MHVMNEYMAVDDADGKRVATFPSVITTLSPEGEPLSVGQLKEGMYVFILHVPKEIIPLSASVLDPTVYPACRKGDGHRDHALRPGDEGLSHGARYRA